MINLLKEIGDAKTIAISGHVRPDGDCVGSCLATCKYLKNALPGAQIKVLLEKPSEVFAFMEGYNDIDSDYVCPSAPFDVFISLDCSTLDRLGQAESLYNQAKKTICVDHHISNQGFGMASCVIPDASSTCEILADLFEKEYMDDKVAEALYVGIVHDTGVFKYSNVKKNTFKVLSEIIEYDFDGTKIIDETFYEKTYVQNQILGRALLESILFMDGNCIACVVDKRMMDFYGVTPKDLDGIVEQLRLTKGVEVAIFMYETATMEYKVSMRSCNVVDVAKIASYFNGGGHVRAAGCTMNGTFYDVVNNLSLHIEEQLIEKGII